MHPDTQMRSGCVEMIYPCNDDLWWHNGVFGGGSRCCECCGTRRVFTCGPCHAEFILSWWRHQMEIFSASLALCVGNSPVTGEFPAQLPLVRIFDVFSDLRLNKRFSKQSWGWWFETPVRSLWRHCKGKITLHMHFYHFLTLRWRKESKSLLVEDNDLHTQCYGCFWVTRSSATIALQRRL